LFGNNNSLVGGGDGELAKHATEGAGGDEESRSEEEFAHG